MFMVYLKGALLHFTQFYHREAEGGKEGQTGQQTEE